MITITADEDRAALDLMIAAERGSLARLRRAVQLHRDVLNSPREHVAEMEAQAVKSAQAIEWMEGERAKLG